MRATPCLASLSVALMLALPGSAQQFNSENLAPYIPSTQAMVDKMLEAAHIKPGETVYDLGSGDGRVLIAAVQKFKAKAVGVELSPELCKTTIARVRKLGLEDRIKVIQGSCLKVDLSPADVVTMYLLTSSNDRMRPKLEQDLKPGARVVSTDFEIRGWKSSEVVKIQAGGLMHTIYVYEVGPKKIQ